MTNAMPITFATIDVETKSLLDFVARQDASLRNRVAPFVEWAMGSDPIDIESARGRLESWYVAVRGVYLTAPDKKTKTARGRQWNSIRTAAVAAVKARGLVVAFPPLISGGTVTLVTASDAAMAAKQAKADRAETDAADIQAAEQALAERELEALRAMTPEQLAGRIDAMLQAWNGDRSAVLGLLVGEPTTPATKRTATKRPSVK